MGVVHHGPGAVFFGEGHNLVQLAYVAAHAENAVCNDEDPCCLGWPLSTFQANPYRYDYIAPFFRN